MQRRVLMSCALLGLTGLLSACSTPQLSDYVDAGPKLDLRDYFNGQIDAWGMFTNRSGQVVKRFTVKMVCTWQGDDGVFEEDFSYADGSQEKRIWKVKRLANGHYTAQAGDVVGEASGQQSGFAAQWRYTLKVPVNGSPYEFQFDDWMYLVSDKVMLNRATMSKFGVRLGEVTLSFTKR